MNKHARLSTINRLIRKHISPEWELVRGDGYFYFIGPGTEYLYTASVYVPYLYQLPVDVWLAEGKRMFDEAQTRLPDPR